MKKSYYFMLIFLLLCSFSYSQQLTTEILKSTLQSSTLAVFSAQKLLLSKDKKQAEGKLSKAVFFQLKAIDLYKKNMLNESFCYTIFSRELSIEIITKEGGNLNPNYKLSVVEINQKSGCKNTTDFFLNARNSRMDLPDDDSYFVDMEKLLSCGINENY
jgi:hypothetical protein